MPKIAQSIEVKRDKEGCWITIDGEEFPWFVEDGVSLSLNRGQAPGVTVSLSLNRGQAPGVTFTLLADKVTVSDELLPSPPED